MEIHFIWIGNRPHPNIIQKILTKAKYLNTVFNNNTCINIWTTNDLVNSINVMCINDSFYNTKMKIKIVDTLFKIDSYDPNTTCLNNSDFKALYRAFISELKGAVSNIALAADILKFLILFHSGGLYVDAGLDCNFGKGKSSIIKSIHNCAMKKYYYAKKWNYVEPGGMYNKNICNILENCNYAITSFKDFKISEGYILSLLYDYFMLAFKDQNLFKEYQLDIQILYANSKSNRYLFQTILYEIADFEKKGNITAFKESRVRATNDSSTWLVKGKKILCNPKCASYTADTLRDNSQVFSDIYLFELMSSRIEQLYFSDFPEIYLKDGNKDQKYENYRTKTFKTKDDW